ncbi:MAG: helix-turn-helix transcriptional regulator [Butyricicoccus sp.]|nr:helix-turn-helix transcriptional regulator [Butyricicoccus sp.]
MAIDQKMMAGSTTLLVLSLLRGGEKYGYEMIMELARRSDNTFQLREGTLYPILHKLEQDRMVEAFERETPAGKKRRYYRLTRKGEALLTEKAEEWQTFTSKVNAIVFG